MAVPLDRFLRFDDLTTLLRTLCATTPGLATLESIGRSHEGRDIWLVTLTDASTGPHHEKPAMWVDANIHATELTAGAAALHLIDTLVAGFGTDERITRALRTRTFYVVPRVNPDGAELALADSPRFLRSSTRRWPWSADDRSGLYRHDVDGDGRVLTMRIADPDGAWTPHREDERLLVRRPADHGPGDGPTYRLLDEGSVRSYDGFTVGLPGPPERLDLNRNYPALWSTAVSGSGDFPGSEPEVAALVRAITARPNVCGFNAYHTSGAVLLRGSSVKPDSALPAVDVWTWSELGRQGTARVGYPSYGAYDEFTWDRTDTMSGASDDWAYEHLGLYGWTVEFWDVVWHATGQRSPNDWWYVGPTDDHQLAVLRWFDQRAAAALGEPTRPAFVDWYPFEHPQLGPVEIGGWDQLYTWINPPPDLLAAEVRDHPSWAIYQALAAPELVIRMAEVVPLGDDVWLVRVGVANAGWLPTTISVQGERTGRILPVVATLTVPAGAEVVGGPARVELGQLAGRRHLHHDFGAWSDGTADRVLAQWTVRAPAGTAVTVEARHPRAGTTRTTITL